MPADGKQQYNFLLPFAGPLPAAEDSARLLMANSRENMKRTMEIGRGRKEGRLPFRPHSNGLFPYIFALFSYCIFLSLFHAK
jgi:hypothetical protein